LARRFGVSRPVVREALVGLQALGLTKTINGRGCFVASHRISPPMLLGQYTPSALLEVRRCMEVPAARAAAERRTTADLGELAEIVAAMQSEVSADRRKLLDASFHIAIARATANPLFVRLIENLRKILEEHSRAAATVPGRRAEAMDEHRAIYEAIARRDPDGAARAMSAHLDAADNVYVSLPDKGSDAH
jgi:DNA-binding FadR family transcriptional regulator